MIPTEHNGVEVWHLYLLSLPTFTALTNSHGAVGLQELCSGLEKAMNEAGEGMLIAPLASLGVKGPSEGGKPGEGDLDLGTKVVQVSMRPALPETKEEF